MILNQHVVPRSEKQCKKYQRNIKALRNYDTSKLLSRITTKVFEVKVGVIFSL